MNDKLIAVSLDQFKSRKKLFLWWPFFARGQTSLLAGEGDMGKSTISTTLMTLVTTGKPWPKIGDTEPSTPKRGSVVILCKEESYEFDIKQRLKAAGADTSRVYSIGSLDGLEIEDFEVVASLDGAANALAEVIDKIGDVQLIIADPITEFLGTRSMYREDEIRKFFAAINRLCARRNIAFVGIIHMNKDVKREPKHRLMGGAGMYNVPRAVNFVGQGPDKTRYLMMGKGSVNGVVYNVGFNIVGNENGQPVIEWHPDWEENLDIKTILAGQHAAVSKFTAARTMIESWLSAGAVPSAECEERSDAAMVGRTTINKAKKSLGVISVKPNGIWHWALPGKEEPRVDDAAEEADLPAKTGGRAKSRKGGRAKARDLVVSGGRPKARLLN